MRFTRIQLAVGGVALLILLFLLYCFVPVVLGAKNARPLTQVLSGSGDVLYRVGNGQPTTLITEEDIQKTLAKSDDAPIAPAFVDALVASEDKLFFSHGGIDIGALWSSLGEQRGASTITSQVVKLTYFADADRNILQKAREFTVSLWLDAVSSKEALLAEYVNEASFGSGYTGIYAAAQGYFGKAPSMLSLGESAMLVGLLPAPESYSPVRSMARAKERERIVLQRMVTEGKISQADMDETLLIPISLADQEKIILAPHAVQYALDEARQRFPDIDEGGYTVHTTINLAWHQEMTKILQRDLDGLKDKHVTNGAAVVVDPDSGAMRVMIGSRDYFGADGAFNVATAKRQPGSSLKPFTYLAAFLQGKSPGTIIYDIESSFPTAAGDPYMPRNYDLKFHGPVSMRTALGSSLNIPAVKTLDMVGFTAWYELLKHFGITFEKPPEFYGLGITLGGGEVTLKDLTHAYSMLANNGRATDAYMIEKIEKDGKTVYEHPAPAGTSLLPEDQAHFEAGMMMVNDVLRDNKAREISFGLTSRLQITDAVAVKTGTTKDYRDNWAFGYTPRLAVGVWVGNNDNSPMEGVTGITGAIPILHDFLRLRTTETLPEHVQWLVSPLVVKKKICTLSGMLATPLCPNTAEELYIQGTEPKETDTWYTTLNIDTISGKIADETCQEHLVKKTFLKVPAELQRWADSILLETAPHVTCSGKELLPAAAQWSISQPKNGDVFVLRENMPQQAQQIPVHIDGSGYLNTTLYIDQKPLEIKGSLPLTRFIDLSPGEHMLTGSGTTLTFTVR